MVLLNLYPLISSRSNLDCLGGHLKPAVYSRLPDFIAKYGAETAAEYAEFEYKHVDVIAEVIKKENIWCEFEIVRSFDLYLDPEQAIKAKNVFEIKGKWCC